ncbi:MAG: hypothetical protein P8X57_03060, partial [Cyclobacteriaceae bacterium]
SNLREACELHDYSRIQALAHKMIPPCRHLGFDTAVRHLKTLEKAAEESDNLKIGATIDALSNELKLLYPEIEKELSKLTHQQPSSSI